jgi:hypothetical protein
VLHRAARATATLLPVLASALGASAAGASPPDEALIHDLSMIIETQQAAGWKIDRYEYEDMMPDALQSVCATTDATRIAARDRLGRRIDALGGPVEEAYRRLGRRESAIKNLLFTTRIFTLLTEAMRRAPTECPFWITPSPAFRGLQTDAGRFTLSFESGGLFALSYLNQRVMPGAGGSGRLVFGRGFDERWTLLAGPEFGAIALFQQDESSTNFPINFVVALPVVLRHHDISWHYEVELAPIGYFTSTEPRPSYGARIGGLIGISTLKVRRIIPWGGVGVGVEYVFGNQVRPMTMSIKGGIRLGFNWDF